MQLNGSGPFVYMSIVNQTPYVENAVQTMYTLKRVCFGCVYDVRYVAYYAELREFD